MTEIYLIRHAQAEGNSYRMMQGHWDGDVTAVGRRQIDALAERFRNVPLDALYASDLYRTRLTATAVTRYHALPLRTDRRLREINVGRWETRFFGNVVYEEPALAHAFMYEQDKWSIEGGETYAQVGERAWQCLNEIIRAHPEQRVAVVSHGVTIRCLLSRISGIPLQDVERLPISGNTAVAHLLCRDGAVTVDYWNDCGHLAALGLPQWSRVGDLRHEPLDPRRDRDYYCACYADSWQNAHGSLLGYSEETYWNAARRHLKRDSQSVLRLYLGDEPAGLVDLDTDRSRHLGCGWVSLLYLAPAFRGKGYGIQALARAVGRYRDLGRRSLRLLAAEDNTQAMAFYKRQGFYSLSYEASDCGRLWLLERSLEVPRDV